MFISRWYYRFKRGGAILYGDQIQQYLSECYQHNAKLIERVSQLEERMCVIDTYLRQNTDYQRATELAESLKEFRR